MVYQITSSLKIGVVATWCSQTCWKLLKQLALVLWIKLLTINSHQACWQLAADLLSSSRSKRCERILISAWWQQGNKPAADLLQLAHFWLCTHAKISQLVASLQTSRQQVVFARLVTSCQQVWNKLLTTCNNLVDIVKIVTRLFQQGCYSHDITILLQPCLVNLVTFLLYHDCIRPVRTTL